MHYCQFGCFYFQHIYVGFPLLLKIWTSCGLSLVWCPHFPSQPLHDVSELSISCAIGEKLRTSQCTDWDFVYTHVAIPLPILIDSTAPLEKIWKSYPEFVAVVKPCTAEVLEELLLLWTITALLVFLVPWPLLVTSLEALCIGYLYFPISLVAGLVSYFVNLLNFLQTSKSMTDPL